MGKGTEEAFMAAPGTALKTPSARIALLTVLTIILYLVLTGCSTPANEEEIDAAHAEGYASGYDMGFAQGREEAAAEEVAAAPENTPFETAIDTPYYTVTLPESWAGTYDCSYEEDFGNQHTAAGGRGAVTTITNKADGKTMFIVACAIDDYPGIGNGLIEEDIGRTTIEPGYRVLLGRMLSSNVGDEAQGYGDGYAFGPDRTAEYVNYITIK